jgi:chemotaxis protein CheD
MIGFSPVKRYFDPVNNCHTAKLLPGEFYVTTGNEMITTVLGSCVSACIFDPRTNVGGMNHFMLPGSWSGKPEDASARYGLYAMESLINAILKRGCRKEDLRAKLFGGGQIIANMTDVGQKNISFAKTFLDAEGIPLDGADLGLVYPRKVNFFPGTGKVMVKRLQALNNSTIEDREMQYMKCLATHNLAGEIDLFQEADV